MQEEPTGAEAPVDNSPSGRPEHIPEKFWDADKGEANYEALAKSYSELEKKLGAPRQEEPQAEPTNEPTAEQQAEAAQVSNILQANGLDPERFTVEIQQNGQLSDESYAELAGKGFPKEMVDQYLAGAGLISEYTEVLTQAQLSEVYEATGGEDGFNAMSQWAAQNVDEKNLQTYNEMVNSGNVAQAKAAVTWLKTMYVEANGNEPSLVNGDTFGRTAVEPFRSNAQLTAAMRDPRYHNDPAYRAEVYERLRVSSV